MGNDLFVLYLSFKYDLEYTERDMRLIVRIVGGWARPCMHGKKTAWLVMESRESLELLAARIRPGLDSVDALENYWISPAPILIEAKHGSIDPFRSRIVEGWGRVRQRRQP